MKLPFERYNRLRQGKIFEHIQDVQVPAIL